jgi:hypothetical protein
MPDKKNKAPWHRPVQSPSGDVLIRARTRGLFNSKPFYFFEKDFNDLLNYCRSSGIQIINDYHAANLRGLLRLFPKEEIEIAIDIARAHGCLKNWIKYTAGILWTRKREGKANYEISEG